MTDKRREIAHPSSLTPYPSSLRIVYLSAGAAGMYCGSCLHDNTLAAALLEAGHDVLLVPTYTPLRTDEPDVSIRRMFFGGINVYLQQKSALFRHTPWLVDSLLDSPSLINLVTHGGPSVEAEKLGDLTVSMLAGKEGNQRKELDKLVYWLRHDVRPDVVHLSNSMFVGMAEPIRALGVSVVCTLSGEDLFLEKLPPPHYEEARRLLREQSRHVDAFVAMNRYYADFMADYLNVPRERVHVIPHGLKLEGHGTRRPSAVDGSRTIGYFARICPEKGLHLLVAAFEQLVADPQMPPLRLRAAGYLGNLDKPYLEKIQQRVRSWPQPERFEYLGEIDRANKIAFLQSLDVLSVPTVYRESKGLSALEAMANAVPVVLPAHGTFPELIDDTGGGLLHEPENPTALAESLKRLLLDDHRATALGRSGQQAIRDRYHSARMAEKTAELYRKLLPSQRK
jgi:glycosyltransferase involved in cell wall biosynthesis